MKNLFFVSFTLLCSILFVKNESLAFAIQDSTLTSSQVSSLNQVRAVGLQTVGTVVVWNQTGDPGDMYNDDGRPVWLECDGSSFDTGLHRIGGDNPNWRFTKPERSVFAGRELWSGWTDCSRYYEKSFTRYSSTFSYSFWDCKLAGCSSRRAERKWYGSRATILEFSYMD